MAIKECLGKGIIFGKHFITGRDVSIRRKREGILRGFAKVASERTDTGCRVEQGSPVPLSGRISSAEGFNELYSLARRRIIPSPKPKCRLDLNALRVEIRAYVRNRFFQVRNLIGRDRNPNTIGKGGHVQSSKRTLHLATRPLSEHSQAIRVMDGGNAVKRDAKPIQIANNPIDLSIAHYTVGCCVGLDRKIAAGSGLLRVGEGFCHDLPVNGWLATAMVGDLNLLRTLALGICNDEVDASLGHLNIHESSGHVASGSIAIGAEQVAGGAQEERQRC